MKRTPIHDINIPQLKQSRFDTQKSHMRVPREIAAPFSSPAFWLTSNLAVAQRTCSDRNYGQDFAKLLCG